MRKFIILGVTALTACVSPAQQQANLRAAAEQRDKILTDRVASYCQQQGHKEKSKAYKRCVENGKIEALRIEENNQRIAALRAQMEEEEKARRVAAAMVAYSQWDRQRAQQFQPAMQTQCTNWVGGMNCTSYGR